MGRRRTAEEIKARQAARGMDPVERATDPTLNPLARAMLKNPTNEAVQANFELSLKRAMMSDEEKEAEINEKTQEKHDELRRQWQEGQDRKFGLVPGTTAGFNKFAKGVVDVGTQIADAAMEIPGIGTLAKEVYKNFAPPGSKHFKNASGEEKLKSLVNPFD